jgi:sensor histidine kinase YesM
VEGQHFHPLEAISFFRRWPRSFLRNVIYTLIFNAMFAVGFLLLGLMFTRVQSASQVWSALGNNLVLSNVIGFGFWGVFELIGPVLRVVNRQSFVVIALFYAVIGTGITTMSFYLMRFLPGYGNLAPWLFSTQQLVTSFTLSLVISVVLAFIWRRRIDNMKAELQLTQERTRVEAAERAAAQANLRALQAQIEPHFLFNTLANVVGLIHSQPDTAKLMLENFIAYLRASLATTRDTESTLGDEFKLMEHFLSLLQIRMGDRLQVATTLPSDLAFVNIPPMLLQPLVENAIKHGLEPKVEGGRIELRAERDGDVVKVSVIDNGVGFSGATSNGIGLKNVRERMERLFGGKGSMVIEENQPSGTRVTLRIPG